MTQQIKNLSNPFSTGGGGIFFESHVQSAFAVLMLAGGYAPCSPAWPINKILLQGRYAGYNTDDLIIFLKDPVSETESKILAQIKHSITITKNSKIFGEVIRSAWYDFNNGEIFNPDKDVIALITGPLSITDIEDVRPILEWARHSESASDFIRTKVELAKFSSNQKRAKLEAFRAQLNKANGADITDDQLWRFMKCFHFLGYDLDIRMGVTLSLLHSLIGQYSPENAQNIWRQIVEEIQSVNKNAGTLIIESFSSDVLRAFERRAIQTIPKELLPTVPSEFERDLSSIEYASELAIAMLAGAWDEANDNDKVAIEYISGFSYSDWIIKMREVLILPESPLILKNGKWEFVKRKEGWNTLGKRVFDEHLERFGEIVVRVLKETHPKFELPPEDQLMAEIQGKVLSYSQNIRKGLAESLALIGSYPDSLSSCSIGKAEETVIIAVREILIDANEKEWASLNGLLPLLAEGAPRELLGIVEKALNEDPCPFDGVFSLEDSGAMGRTYISGLLWALETLAWDSDYLVPVVVSLGGLASRDPGGVWANRPISSLTTIFLPWLPQTCASIEKRKIAIETLVAEHPDIAWNLLISLLPRSNRVSLGSRKPEWRKIIPESCSEKVSRKDYWTQIDIYSEMAIKMAESDPLKLTEFISHLDDLPKSGQEHFLTILESDMVVNLPESEKYQIWINLTNLVTKHRKFATAQWAMRPEQVDKIEAIAKPLASGKPSLRHRRLFCGRIFDLFEGEGDFQDQKRKLDELRLAAVNEIFDLDGIPGVLDFTLNVESPNAVGYAFGLIAIDELDKEILPSLLDIKEDALRRFAEGYVISKYHKNSGDWVDHMDFSSWNPAQIGQFFAYLPFSTPTWEHVSTLLKDDESPYWIRANPLFFESDIDLDFAVDRLIFYGRTYAAIALIHAYWHREKSLNVKLIVRALLAAFESKDSPNDTDIYAIIDLIKILQNDPNTDSEDLFRIEWAYLPLLDHHMGASPKFLEWKLANEPEFFCNVIRVVFKSIKEDQQDKATEEERRIATNTYRLLSEWSYPPGLQADGGYDGAFLVSWLEAVESECERTGHLEIAKKMIGQVLIHTPADSDGLWIHKSAAKVLNAKTAENMRKGFRTALFFSRGVYQLTAGKEERTLAEKYRVKAEAVESHGFHRLAETLKNLADEYEIESKRQTGED